jgi:hypothetical protein
MPATSTPRQQRLSRHPAPCPATSLPRVQPACPATPRLVCGLVPPSRASTSEGPHRGDRPSGRWDPIRPATPRQPQCASGRGNAGRMEPFPLRGPLPCGPSIACSRLSANPHLARIRPSLACGGGMAGGQGEGHFSPALPPCASALHFSLAQLPFPPTRPPRPPTSLPRVRSCRGGGMASGQGEGHLRPALTPCTYALHLQPCAYARHLRPALQPCSARRIAHHAFPPPRAPCPPTSLPRVRSRGGGMAGGQGEGHYHEGALRPSLPSPLTRA